MRTLAAGALAAGALLTAAQPASADVGALGCGVSTGCHMGPYASQATCLEDQYMAVRYYRILVGCFRPTTGDGWYFVYADK